MRPIKTAAVADRRVKRIEGIDPPGSPYGLTTSNAPTCAPAEPHCEPRALTNRCTYAPRKPMHPGTLMCSTLTCTSRCVHADSSACSRRLKRRRCLERPHCLVSARITHDSRWHVDCTDPLQTGRARIYELITCVVFMQ